MDTQTLADQAGISYRQLDYWLRLDLVSGELPGSGNKREWSPASVRHVRMMGRLVRGGIAPPKAAELAAQLVRNGRAQLAPGIWVSAS